MCSDQCVTLYLLLKQNKSVLGPYPKFLQNKKLLKLLDPLFDILIHQQVRKVTGQKYFKFLKIHYLMFDCSYLNIYKTCIVFIVMESASFIFIHYIIP